MTTETLHMSDSLLDTFLVDYIDQSLDVLTTTIIEELFLAEPSIQQHVVELTAIKNALGTLPQKKAPSYLKDIILERALSEECPCYCPEL